MYIYISYGTICRTWNLMSTGSWSSQLQWWKNNGNMFNPTPCTSLIIRIFVYGTSKWTHPPLHPTSAIPIPGDAHVCWLTSHFWDQLSSIIHIWLCESPFCWRMALPMTRYRPNDQKSLAKFSSLKLSNSSLSSDHLPHHPNWKPTIQWIFQLYLFQWCYWDITNRYNIITPNHLPMIPSPMVTLFYTSK